MDGEGGFAITVGVRVGEFSRFMNVSLPLSGGIIFGGEGLDVDLAAALDREFGQPHRCLRALRRDGVVDAEFGSVFDKSAGEGI